MANCYDILLKTGGPDPSKLYADPGDKVKWTNELKVTVTDFILPTCLAPHEPPFSILPGKSTREFTVDNVHGTFGYHYKVPDSPDTGAESGTIDVSS